MENITNPASPSTVGSYTTLENTADAVGPISNGIGYAAVESDGLVSCYVDSLPRKGGEILDRLDLGADVISVTAHDSTIYEAGGVGVLA